MTDHTVHLRENLELESPLISTPKISIFTRFTSAASRSIGGTLVDFIKTGSSSSANTPSAKKFFVEPYQLRNAGIPVKS